MENYQTQNLIGEFFPHITHIIFLIFVINPTIFMELCVQQIAHIVDLHFLPI